MPWLGYFDQIASCDAFIFYDDVQYDRNGWRNRNRIRTPSPEGWSWLTVPVRVTGFPLIKDVEIDARAPWQRKHHAALTMAYAKAPHREFLERYFGEFFAAPFTTLADAALASIRAGMVALELRTPLYRSSELGIEGDRNTRLLNICRHFKADTYLSGNAAKSYLDTGLFDANGIQVEWQEYIHPTYTQTAQPFISHLSAIDALLNAGPEARAFVGKRGQ